MKDERPTALRLTVCDGMPLELPKSVVAKWQRWPIDPNDETIGTGILLVTGATFIVRESCDEVARQYGECV
jgi:hypothetical protein